MCPLCFGEKDFLAPVCASCTHEVPLRMQILGWMLFKIGQLIGFILSCLIIYFLVYLISYLTTNNEKESLGHDPRHIKQSIEHNL